MFDPAKIPDDACAEGHLDSDPIYGVLLSLGQKLVTGRLTIADAAGDNHMYFMQGRPVGVHLAEHFHPLGQLLLEIGRLDGATFVRAQRLIAEGSRLPGQVYKELGILDDAGLKEVLSIQARRKAEHFCRLGSRPFLFCRGLTWLTGFTSTPLDPHAVIFLAVRQQMGEQSREGWLEAARGEQVRGGEARDARRGRGADGEGQRWQRRDDAPGEGDDAQRDAACARAARVLVDRVDGAAGHVAVKEGRGEEGREKVRRVVVQHLAPRAVLERGPRRPRPRVGRLPEECTAVAARTRRLRRVALARQPPVVLRLLPDAVRLRHLRHPHPRAHVALRRRGEVLLHEEGELRVARRVPVALHPVRIGEVPQLRGGRAREARHRLERGPALQAELGREACAWVFARVPAVDGVQVAVEVAAPETVDEPRQIRRAR